MNGDIEKLERQEYDPPPSLRGLMADLKGQLTVEEALQLLDELKREELYGNDEYQVAVDKTPTHGFRGFTMWHLSIRRRDREPIHDWRDLQAIKNQLCGPEAEAIELYPAESRKVDHANQFHLFVFMRDAKRKRLPRVPVGWTRRLVDDQPYGKAKQRPLPAGEDKTPVGGSDR